jgi:hypothetical protein
MDPSEHAEIAGLTYPLDLPTIAEDLHAIFPSLDQVAPVRMLGAGFGRNPHGERYRSGYNARTNMWRKHAVQKNHASRCRPRLRY